MEKSINERKINYNYMSFTGYKSLLIFSMLISAPCSFQEIADVIKSKDFLKDNISRDTLRVYINSFKRFGCEIKRTKSNGVSKYFITKHPFTVSLSLEQCESILKIYKSLIKNLDIKELLYVYNLLEKIGQISDDKNFIANLKNLSFLKNIDKNLLEQLITCCDNKYKISVVYNSPNSGDKDIEICTDKVEIFNNKIYLYGFGFEYKEYCKFLINRIKKINGVDINYKNDKDFGITKIIYELDNSYTDNLMTNERIIAKNNGTSIIEMETNNLFLAKQRLLEFGPLCKVIELEDFKSDFVKILQDMKKEYSND